VATASLVTALFIPDRLKSNPEALVHGLHHGFIALGALTVFSALGFYELKPNDGENVSLHKAAAAEA